MIHLTIDSWQRLRSGTLGPDERAAVEAHLCVACEACDALVESLPDDLALDARVDAALACLVAEVAPSLLFAQVERQVLRKVYSRPARRWLAAVPIALAASAVLVIFNPFAAAQLGQRTKGDPLRSPALSAMVSVKTGAPLEPLEPLDHPHSYPTSAELYFTYDLPQDSHVYMGRVGIDGVVEAFYPPLGSADAVEHAGLHSLTVGGTVHAYSLDGLRGKQRFVLLSSPTALEPQALQRALKDGAEGSVSVELEVDSW